MEHIDLTQAEWRLMEALWDHAPQTGRELTERMKGAAAQLQYEKAGVYRDRIAAELQQAPASQAVRTPLLTEA